MMRFMMKPALRKVSFGRSNPIRTLSTGLPSDRLPALKKLLDDGKKQNKLPLRIIETHSGLTGLIAEHAKGEGGQQYDGMWSSSLTASAACGMPDIEAVDTTARLGIVKDTLNVTTKPMIYDGDTGGLPEIFKFTVRQLEQLGVSAVIIEDKEGLKQNSLLADSNALQNIIDIDEFCNKIKAGLEARRDPNFMIIARMESLIAGLPMEVALSRATACVDAGASGIMIHSRKKSPDEVVEFIAKFRASPGCEDVPVVVVPSSYNTIYESELRDAGASICIYANHLLRASYPAMLDVAETILSSSRCAEATPKIMSIKEITNFINHDAEFKSPTDTAKSYASKPPSQMKKAAFSTAAFSTAAALDPDIKDDKVCPEMLLTFLKQELGMSFFTGVPDSCIKTFCAEIDRQGESDTDTFHAIAANEGASVALAVGNYLATKDVPLVYMQNSGLGNACNPLMSAAHPEVYGIPMVLVLGWRGAPGVKDEPQHVVTGRKCQEMLASMDVKTFVLPKNGYDAKDTFREAHDFAKANNCPVAVLVEPKTFSSGPVSSSSVKPTSTFVREKALSQLVHAIGPSDAVVSTTGFTSRELYELRASAGATHASDFLCVGSMGHALAIAQGIAMAQPERTVWCIDGDGAALMHMGSFALSSSFGLSNLRHVLINNDAHESVGGQKTAASQQPSSGNDESGFDFVDMASSAGYTSMGSAESGEELEKKLSSFGSKDGPTFLEVKVSVGTRKDLGRPKTTTQDAKKAFMGFLENEVTPTLSTPNGFTSTGDALLLTPGPLTTSASVKNAMLYDYGSRDSAFVEVTQRVRKQVINVLQGENEDLTAVLLQGSGTFAVEAMLTQFVPATGKVIIFCNGAYGKRMGQICEANGRPYEMVVSAESEPIDVSAVNEVLDAHPDASHVAIISCETTTGVLNPVSEIADAVKSRGKKLLIDAMSSFGIIDLDANMPFDAIAASSNKALQGSPGLGFVVANKKALIEGADNANSLSLDLHAQWKGFEATGEWRFTPPTHCLLALGQALDEFETEGGTLGRRTRYAANCKTLVDGMRQFGFETMVADESQAPVIVTFRMPDDPKFEFQDFYSRLSAKGYVIYPGKLTTVPSFRVGCVGNVFPEDMQGFIEVVGHTLEEMDVSL